jgi:predicted MFS family arabinose efflux permease
MPKHQQQKRYKPSRFLPVVLEEYADGTQHIKSATDNQEMTPDEDLDSDDIDLDSIMDGSELQVGTALDQETLLTSNSSEYEEDGTEHRKKKQRTLRLLLLTHAVLLMDQHMISPHITDIARCFNMHGVARDKNVGAMLHFVLLFCGLPAAVGVGFFGDVLPRKGVYLALTLTVAVSDVCILFVTDFWQLILLRALASAQVACWPVIVCMISDMFSKDQRPRAIAEIGAAASVGLGAGQLLSAHVGDGMRWRLPFAVVGVLNLVSCLVFFLYAHEPGHRPRDVCIESLRAKSKRILNRNNVLLFVHSATQTVPTTIMAVWLLDYIFVDRHAPSKLIAFLLYAFLGVGIIVGEMLAPHVYEKMRFCVPGSKVCGMKALVMLCYLVPIVPLLLLVNLPFGSHMGVEFCVIGFCMGLNDTTTSVLAMHLNQDEDQAAVFSVYAFSDAVGKGLGPLFTASLISVMGRTRAFSVTSMFWAVSAAIVGLLEV